MDYLYKYAPHNNDSRKYEIITKSQLWFSKVESFNDPIDSKLDYRQEYTEDEIKQYWENFIKNKPDNPPTLDKLLQDWGNNSSFIEHQNRGFDKYRKGLGVFCFSKNPKNILMWSHYANNHKGIVYEFKPSLFTDKKTSSFNAFPYKVNYPNDRCYDLLSHTLKEEKKKEQFAKELLTKANDWQYEEEYRMIDFENSGNKVFNKESLISIIFGVRTNKVEIDILRYLCVKHGFSHIKFKKAQFKKAQFEIEIIDI